MSAVILLGQLGAPALRAAQLVAPRLPAPTIHAPVPLSPHEPSTLQEVDAAVARLKPDKWAKLGLQDRQQLLQQCAEGLLASSGEVARLSGQAKGTWGTDEELLVLLPVFMALAELRHALQAHGAPRPHRLRTHAPTGQTIAQVFPWGPWGILLPGTTGEVWLQPGKPATQGQAYRQLAAGQAQAQVAVVLGAGNQTPVVLLDIMHKLFVDNTAVVCKMSPVNDYLGSVLETALSPLIDIGALSFVYGGREVGQHLVAHPAVTTVHLTGALDTANAIVWGSPTAKREGVPPLEAKGKTITAELGNVTPFIIVPGEWSAAEMRRVAAGVVAGLTHNAGHNCIAMEVLVTAGDWPQRQAFLTEVRRQLDACSRRVPYYPGSEGKYHSFKQRLEGLGEAYELGAVPPVAGVAPESGKGPDGMQGLKPWVLVQGVAPDKACLDTENWCGVAQEVPLPGTGSDPAAFLAAALDFANNRCWGSLAVSVFCSPSTQRQLGAQWQDFIAGLRYGSVVVNAPTSMGFVVTTLPWGAFPGNTPTGMESGIGHVHNTYLYDHAEKGVLYAPWDPAPKPLWAADNRAVGRAVPPLLKMMVHADSMLHVLPGIAAVAVAAVRG